MPTTWEWGPLADAMEKESVRRMRIKEEEGRMARQGIAGQQGMDLAKFNRAAALEQMIQGKKLDVAKEREVMGMKEAATERAYQAEIPALKAMFEGNPELRKAAGMERTMPVPQAEPGVYGVERQPISDMELRGIAPLMKNAFPTLLQKNLPSPPQPFTLGAGQTRFSPEGAPVAQGVDIPKAGFPTYVEAAIQRATIERLHPESKGRIAIRQSERTGNFVLAEQTTSPLDIHSRAAMAAFPSDINAQSKFLAERRGEEQGFKTRAGELNKALPVEVQTVIKNLAIVENNQKKLATFTDAEKTAFLGDFPSWSMWLQNKGSTFPGIGTLIKKFGNAEGLRQRYADFHSLHGAQHQLVFGPAGKVLTPLENKIASKNIPTGEESSKLEYDAKDKYFKRYLAAQNIGLGLLTARMAKGDVTAETVNQIAAQALIVAGVEDMTTNENAWMRELSPTDRVRLKYLGEGKK